jgi:hypothetical protein
MVFCSYTVITTIGLALLAEFRNQGAIGGHSLRTTPNGGSMVAWLTPIE